MNIIGITGRARTGKDTLAKILMERYGYERLAFADPIREFVAHLVGALPKDLMDSKAKEKPLLHLGGKTPREMMQTLGTEWGRNTVHPNVWVECLADEIGFLNWEEDNVVIPDVRFDNEAKMLRSLGGKIIHITRDAAAPVNPHVSEAGISPELIDLEIANNGSLDDLERHAQRVVFE